jgi:hypothetical protein
MESILKNNSETYIESFLSENNAKPNMFWFDSGDQYRFKKIEEITRYKGTVRVKIVCDLLSDIKVIREVYMTYYFEKWLENEYKIQMID